MQTIDIIFTIILVYFFKILNLNLNFCDESIIYTRFWMFKWLKLTLHFCKKYYRNDKHI